jgi:rubrerythrin
MRRLTVEEENLKDLPVIKDVNKAAICALCGAELERDDESGEYRCPICDNALPPSSDTD